MTSEPTGADQKRETVKIEVDNQSKDIAVDTYRVSTLKDMVGVPADKDLDQVIDGNLTTLADEARVRIVGGEVFFSHVRRGGAS